MNDLAMARDCEVCGTIKDVGILTLLDDFNFDVCRNCNEDKPKLVAWFKAEFEQAMKEESERLNGLVVPS